MVEENRQLSFQLVYINDSHLFIKPLIWFETIYWYVNVCLRYMDMVWKLQQQQEMEIASNARGMMMRDHDAQFGYRVQPIQPNLQEKIMSLVIDWSYLRLVNLMTNLLSISGPLNCLYNCVSLQSRATHILSILLFLLKLICVLLAYELYVIGCVVCFNV